MPALERYDGSSDFDLLRDAVREAGAAAREMFESGVEHWNKADGTPVSQADLTVDTLLRERLLQGRHGYGWLSEETHDEPSRLLRSRVWVVDPIDGTRAFLRGDPHWTISVALVEAGRPVLAAVFNPVTDEFFEAVAGGGARRNGDTIKASGRSDLEGSRILIHKDVARSKTWHTPWPDMAREMRNSVAYRLCLVAAGTFDATMVMSAKSEWDLAGGDLIVHEAGGRVTTHAGDDFAYNQANSRVPNVVAAGPGLYDELLDRAQRRRKRT